MSTLSTPDALLARKRQVETDVAAFATALMEKMNSTAFSYKAGDLNDEKKAELSLRSNKQRSRDDLYMELLAVSIRQDQVPVKLAIHTGNEYLSYNERGEFTTILIPALAAAQVSHQDVHVDGKLTWVVWYHVDDIDRKNLIIPLLKNIKPGSKSSEKSKEDDLMTDIIIWDAYGFDYPYVYDLVSYDYDISPSVFNTYWDLADGYVTDYTAYCSDPLVCSLDSLYGPQYETVLGWDPSLFSYGYEFFGGSGKSKSVVPLLKSKKAKQSGGRRRKKSKSKSRRRHKKSKKKKRKRRRSRSRR